MKLSEGLDGEAHTDLVQRATRPSTAIAVGVIGAGGIAARHIGNVAGMPNVRVVGVADVSVERAEEQAARVGATAYGDWRQMLDQSHPDAVLICVPPFAHGEPELALTQLRIPFFVEKPIATELDTAVRIAAAVSEQRLITAVGYHWRYLDTVERAAELLASRPPHLAMGYWIDSVPPREWWVRQSLSGGQLVEQATHIFDVARFLVGEIVRISAIEIRVNRRDGHGGDIPDGYVAAARFATGTIGSFAATSLVRWPHQIGLDLVSEGMVLELSEFELVVDEGAGRHVTRASTDPFVAELRDFFTAAAGGRNAIRVPYEEAVKTHAVAVAATTSAHDGGRELALPSDAQ